MTSSVQPMKPSSTVEIAQECIGAFFGMLLRVEIVCAILGSLVGWLAGLSGWSGGPLDGLLMAVKYLTFPVGIICSIIFVLKHQKSNDEPVHPLQSNLPLLRNGIKGVSLWLLWTFLGILGGALGFGFLAIMAISVLEGEEAIKNHPAGAWAVWSGLALGGIAGAFGGRISLAVKAVIAGAFFGWLIGLGMLFYLICFLAEQDGRFTLNPEAIRGTSEKSLLVLLKVIMVGNMAFWGLLPFFGALFGSDPAPPDSSPPHEIRDSAEQGR